MTKNWTIMIKLIQNALKLIEIIRKTDTIYKVLKIKLKNRRNAK